MGGKNSKSKQAQQPQPKPAPAPQPQPKSIHRDPTRPASSAGKAATGPPVYFSPPPAAGSHPSRARAATTATPAGGAGSSGGGGGGGGGHTAANVDPGLQANHLTIGNMCICSDFLGGYCRHGSKCWFKHLSLEEFAQATAFMEMEQEQLKNQQRPQQGGGSGSPHQQQRVSSSAAGGGGGGWGGGGSATRRAAGGTASSPPTATAGGGRALGGGGTGTSGGSPGTRPSPKVATPAAQRTRGNTTTTTSGPRPQAEEKRGLDFNKINPKLIFPCFPYRPTDEDQIKMIEGKDDDPELQCCICFEQLEEGDQMMMLPCMHRFHADCTADWLKRKATCPSCSSDVARTGSEFLTA